MSLFVRLDPEIDRGTHPLGSVMWSCWLRRDTSRHSVLFQAEIHGSIHPSNYSQWRPQEFFSGGGGSTNSVEDRGQRGRGSGGSSPLVRGSGGSCNLVQEISFHILKFPQFLVI